MLTKTIATLLSTVLTVLLLTQNSEAQVYDPEWEPGDRWQVQYKIWTQQNLKKNNSPIRITEIVIYSYSVVSSGSDQLGRNTVTIHAVAPGWPSYELIMDKDDILVLSVAEMVSPNTDVVSENPFEEDSWMHRLDQWNLNIIHDFPKVDSPPSDQIRTVIAEQSTTGEFKENTWVASDGAHYVMSRFDPEDGQLHQSEIIWVPGEKWWSSAKITHGGEVQITGLLR